MRLRAQAQALPGILGRSGRRTRRRRTLGERAIVIGALRFVGQHPIRLGELGGAPGRHLLKLLAEMLDLVRMVARDLRAERALDLVGGRRRRDLEHVVVVLRQGHAGLLLELGDVGGRKLARSLFGEAVVAFAQTFGTS